MQCWKPSHPLLRQGFLGNPKAVAQSQAVEDFMGHSLHYEALGLATTSRTLRDCAQEATLPMPWVSKGDLTGKPPRALADDGEEKEGA